MRSDDDQRFRDALVVGSLLAPEGAAAYGTAMRWWGWTAGDAGRRARGSGGSRARRALHHAEAQTGHAARAPRRALRARVRQTGAHVRRRPPRRARAAHPRHRSRAHGGRHVRPQRPLRRHAAAAAALEMPGRALDLRAPHRRTSSASPAARCRGDSDTSSSASACCPPDDPRLAGWRKLLGAGYSLLERGGPAEGPFVRRWRLRVNVPGLRVLRAGRAASRSSRSRSHQSA